MKFFKLLTVALFATLLTASCTSLEGRYDDVEMPIYSMLDPTTGEVSMTYESGATATVTINVNTDYSTIAVSLDDSSWLSYSIEANVTTFSASSANITGSPRVVSATITAGSGEETVSETATITQSTFDLIDLASGEMSLTSEAEATGTVTLNADVDLSTVSISFDDNSWITYYIDGSVISFVATSENTTGASRVAVATISATVGSQSAVAVVNITQAQAPAVGAYSIFDYTDGGIVYWVSDDGLTAKILSLDRAYGSRWCTSDYSSVDHSNSAMTEGVDATATILNGSDYSADNYPAFAYCEEYGDDWYMPSFTEIYAFFTLFETYGEDTVQAAFTENGGTAIDLQYHYSSNESADDVSKVQMARYQTDGGLGNTTLSKTTTTRYTRCSKTVTGGIKEELPYYSLYEATDEGVVIALGDDATTATIISYEESAAGAWAISTAYMVNGNDETLMTSGYEASAAVYNAENYSADNYPSFGYCAGLGEDWYIPSITELEAFITLFIADQTTMQAAFTDNGGMEFTVETYYQSSNESSADTEKANKSKYKEGEVSSTTLSKKGANHYTRCFKNISK